MNGRYADWLTASWLDGAPPTAVRDACRFATPMLEDPMVVDPVLAEAGGPVFARAKVEWDRASRLLTNSNVLKWRLPPGSRIVALGFFNAAINGVFGGVAYLDTPVGVTVAGSWSIPANEVYLGIDPY